MIDIEIRKELINVSLKQRAPDLVLRNANLLNTLSREVLACDIAIVGARIAAVAPAGSSDWLEATETMDMTGKFISPGFIDPHVHVESSMLTVREYAKATVSRGVTMIIADPHEIGNVLGIPGMRLMFDEAKTVPMKMLLRVPARIPAMPDWLETSGAHVSVAETGDLLDWEETCALAGDINPKLLLLKDDDQLAKISLAEKRGMTVSGQSPYLTGNDLNAYIAAGPEDSHVARSIDEIIENQRLGLRTIFALRPHRLHRPELRQLAEHIRTSGMDTRYLQFCTDDVYAHELIDEGHIDTRVRVAIEEGIDTITAYQMATVNVAEGMRIHREYGAIVPGRYADLIVLDNLEKVSIQATMINGQWAFENGRYSGWTGGFSYPDWARNTMHVGRNLTLQDMQVAAPKDAAKAKVRSIAVTSPKTQDEFVLATRYGVVMPDPQQGVSSIVVIDRHRESGRIGKGFVSKLFLERGAIASTVSHDAHNLMVIGASHEDMLLAAQRSIANGGGYALVLDGKVLFELPLPIAGLLCDGDLEDVAQKSLDMIEILHGTLGAPRMQKVLLRMNGLSLPNIPNYGFTDFGLISTNDLAALEPVITPEDGVMCGAGCMHHD